MNNIFVWKTGEKLANKYLKEKGYKILGTNVRNKFCEVDIIAEKGEDIVFCEVKSRENTYFGTPAESVTLKRQHDYVLFSEAYMVSNKLASKNIRFDVIEVLGEEINHIENAFDSSALKLKFRK